MCENIKAAVESAGGSMDDVCRVDVYVRKGGDAEVRLFGYDAATGRLDELEIQTTLPEEFDGRNSTAEIMAAVRLAPDDPRVNALEATVRRRDAVLAAIAYAAAKTPNATTTSRDSRSKTPLA